MALPAPSPVPTIVPASVAAVLISSALPARQIRTATPAITAFTSANKNVPRDQRQTVRRATPVNSASIPARQAVTPSIRPLVVQAIP